MRTRSVSTLIRDQQRAVDYRAYELIRESKSIDWKSVEREELQDLYDDLESIQIFVENENICSQLSELLELIQSELD